MSVFAIGDLHLSLFREKPMDIFGDNWVDHHRKIKENWVKVVSEEDIVLIPGDISWAMNLNEAKMDLDFVSGLPGKKILIKGNHDYWWNSVSRLNSLYPSIYFLQNQFQAYQDIAICGSRGWIAPGAEKFDAGDMKTYLREEGRLKLSLNSAIAKGYKKILVMMHFPPQLVGLEESGIMKIFKDYPVEKVIYGHLHGKDGFGCGIQGVKENIEFALVSADYLDFCPIKILE